MKRVVTHFYMSLLLAAGWVQAQTSPSDDIRESTDPSRAAQVEQKARSLGDTGIPADQSGAGMSGSGTAKSGTSNSGTATGSGAGTGSPAGSMSSPTGTEDMSGAPKSSGSSSGGTQRLQPPADSRFAEPTQPR